MRERFVTVVALLGVGSCVSGFIAEATRPKRDDIHLERGECVYPKNPAFVMGIVAAALLLLAVSLSTSCCGCYFKRGDDVSNTRFVFGILLAIISWLVALYTALIFVLAAAYNWPGRRGKAPGCYNYLSVDNLFQPMAFNAVYATVIGLFSFKIIRA